MESYEEIKEEIIIEEDDDNAEIVQSGRLENSMGQLIAEGIVR